jgi:hypothetical protein
LRSGSSIEITLKAAMSGVLMSMESDIFVRVSTKWKHWLQQSIDHGGDYL